MPKKHKPPEPPPEVMRALLDAEMARYSFKHGFLVLNDAEFQSRRACKGYFKWLDSWPVPDGASPFYWDNCQPSDFERDLEDIFAEELKRGLERARKRVLKSMAPRGRA